MDPLFQSLSWLGFEGKLEHLIAVQPKLKQPGFWSNFQVISIFYNKFFSSEDLQKILLIQKNDSIYFLKIYTCVVAYFVIVGDIGISMLVI